MNFNRYYCCLNTKLLNYPLAVLLPIFFLIIFFLRSPISLNRLLKLLWGSGGDFILGESVGEPVVSAEVIILL